MSQADATIVNVATPSIRAGLGASGAALELVVGGYLIAFAVLLITGARLGQAFGYRRVFLAAVRAFDLASLACGLAAGPVMLVAARVVQGASAALMFPQALTGIQLNFNGPDRIRAIGLYAAALSCGAVAGQILGGLLVSANVAGSHWRAIFLINVPVAAVTVAAGLFRMPAGEQRLPRRIDLVGVATLTASALLAVLPLMLGRPEGWPLWTWLCLAASAPAFALFVLAQRRLASRRRTPGQRARPGPADGLGAAGAAGRDQYVLRAAVHLGPVPAAGSGLPRDDLRAHAGAVGRRVRARRSGRPAATCPPRRARTIRRVPAAGETLMEVTAS